MVSFHFFCSGLTKVIPCELITNLSCPLTLENGLNSNRKHTQANKVWLGCIKNSCTSFKLGKHGLPAVSLLKSFLYLHHFPIPPFHPKAKGGF